MNKIEAAVHLLRRHNRWRRGDDTVSMPDPALLGAAIDIVCDHIDEQSLATIQDSHQPAVPEAVARDAARYRYLAEKCSSHDEQHTGGWSIFIRGIPPRRHDCEDAMDEAIDAAMLAAAPSATQEGKP